MASAADLPDDIEVLKRRLIAREVELAAAKAGLIAKTLEAEKLKFELARLKRMTFGASSERIKREIEQLELKLEELESDEAQGEPAAAPEPSPDAESAEAREKKRRRQLPEHLPHTTTTHVPTSPACATCGSDRLRKVGEDVTEVLEYIPGRFEVTRHVRPAYSCRTCEAMMQAPMSPLPIPRGQAGPGFLAHVAIAKYCDHVPLYRQAEIYARDRVDLDRALLAGWIGRIAWLVKPLADRIGEHVMAGSVIHADDTPIPVLAPGNGKTRTGRLWVYLRDERPHAGSCGTHASGMTPPAVLYRYTPDPKGEHCRAHPAPFRGHLHADGYSGFGQLYESAEAMPAAVTEVACWAHVRHYFFDVHHQNGSPIAKEALDKIGVLFDIERLIAGQVPEQRRRVRADAAKPRLDALKLWFDEQLERIPGRSGTLARVQH